MISEITALNSINNVVLNNVDGKVSDVTRHIMELKNHILDLKQSVVNQDKHRRIEWALNNGNDCLKDYSININEVLYTFRRGEGHEIPYKKSSKSCAAIEKIIHQLTGEKPKMVEMENGCVMMYYA
mmetsp:Transcript_26385/g.30191  ORF Transcript_26385/g.30191 Transcript_26385/m.30191 type:complete len:126 (-) Transcript_26385:178-555(-)